MLCYFCFSIKSTLKFFLTEHQAPLRAISITSRTKWWLRRDTQTQLPRAACPDVSSMIRAPARKGTVPVRPGQALSPPECSGGWGPACYRAGHSHLLIFPPRSSQGKGGVTTRSIQGSAHDQGSGQNLQQEVGVQSVTRDQASAHVTRDQEHV